MTGVYWLGYGFDGCDVTTVQGLLSALQPHFGMTELTLGYFLLLSVAFSGFVGFS